MWAWFSPWAIYSTLADRISEALTTDRLAAALIGVCGVLALLLGGHSWRA
jgi:hypothetical protein